MGGLSFLPADNHIYQLAPYETISEEKYKELLAKFPKIDFSKLPQYEDGNVNPIGELACVNGQCEL